MMVWRALRDPVGVLVASAIVLLVLWGPDGEVPLLGELWSGWRPATEEPVGRSSIVDGVPWDQEWLAFAIGLVLLVAVPCVLIKRVLKGDLRDYGLGLPERSRVRLSIYAALFLLAVSAPAFVLSTGDESMQATYPLYRGELDGWDFVFYELGYLAFFVVIEFVFRGYLLLGLFRDRRFAHLALLVSMLSYTAWHLHKPTPELLGTLVWGPVAGAVVLLTRSIWPVVIVHWLLNVLLDLLLR